MNIIGKQFGMLEVVGYAGFVNEGRQKEHYWYCLCDCGHLSKKRQRCLCSGDTRSCGCLGDKVRNEWIASRFRRGPHATKLGVIWRTMKRRCYNLNSKQYENYGGRGILICDEWKDFPAFYTWAISSGYSEGLTIERINNDNGYSPDNCKWVTRKVQANNRRTNRPITFNGVTLNLVQWAEALGITKGSLAQRIDKFHWSIEESLTIPKGGKRDGKRISAVGKG